jgi:hypothetical protein
MGRPSTSNGDEPPEPECAPLWHEPPLGVRPTDRLGVSTGAHAQKRSIDDRKPTLQTGGQWLEIPTPRIGPPGIAS